jgi:hypothetical protein
MPPRFAHPLLAASVAPRGWGRFYEQVFRNESHSHCLNRLLLLGVFVMRRSTWTPSIVPRGDDQNVYIVLDDFGRSGHAYRETDVETADLETTITDMLDGQYKNPVRVVAFNTSEQCRRTFRKMLPRRSGGAATFSYATSRPASRTSWSATRAGTGANSPCAWCER